MKKIEEEKGGGNMQGRERQRKIEKRVLERDGRSVRECKREGDGGECVRV